MQTALHMLSLVSELGSDAVGAEIVATEFYKKERAAYIFLKRDKSRLAFGFIYHPHGNGVFLAPASKIKIDTREKPWPFFDIKGAAVRRVEQAGFDRIVRFTLEVNGKTAYLICEGLGQNGNLWLLDEQERITATLRKRSFASEQPYQPPSPPEGLNPLDVTESEISTLFGAEETGSPVQILSKNVLGLNRALAREVLVRANVESESVGRDDVSNISRSIRDLAELFMETSTGYLYRIEGKLQAFPFKLSSRDEQPEKFKSLSLAILHLCLTRQTQVEEADERKTVLQAVRRAVKRLERRLDKIEQDIKSARDYENYKRLGELLQIHFTEIAKGAQEIRVKDVYSEPHEDVVISLAPALSPSENVESYFKRYRKGREGLQLLERRMEISRQELDALRQMQRELEDNFEAAYERYRNEISSLLPGEREKAEAGPRMPFRRYALSTGLTILVGRDGSDNDRTTFEFAKPYELWFHAQQCPGSHVVIKYPNKSFEPSMSEIAEAASVAAWFSKARNESVVPVIYAPRKYVRKPRKAKPGLVTVEREKSVMVEPRKPEG